MVLDKLLIKYLEFCEIEKNLTQSTIKMYNFYLSDFIDFLGDNLHKSSLTEHDLTEENIRKYRLALNRRISLKSHEEYKKSTQKTFLIAIRAFLKYLIVEEDLKVVNPEQILLGKSEARVPKVLNDEQMQSLFSVQNLGKKSGLRDRALIETLFSTGLRVSELVNLNIDDVNLNTGEFVVIGKGRKVRTAYLSDNARKWLRQYIGTRHDSYKPLFLRYSGKKMPADDFDGESLRLTQRSVQRLVKKYTMRAGISVDATPHTLRHTFATGLLREGADLRSVQELLGHSNVSTTQIYTHVTNKQLKDIHTRFHKDLDEVDSTE